MTDQQPEALRLAGVLEGWPHSVSVEPALQAAAELRRLHELSEELLAREKRWMELADIEVARCDKLQATNAQLLEALEYLLDPEDMSKAAVKARAAIAAAKEQA